MCQADQSRDIPVKAAIKKGFLRLRRFGFVARQRVSYEQNRE
jgi:hypothetical protein